MNYDYIILYYTVYLSSLSSDPGSLDSKGWWSQIQGDVLERWCQSLVIARKIRSSAGFGLFCKLLSVHCMFRPFRQFRKLGSCRFTDNQVQQYSGCQMWSTAVLEGLYKINFCIEHFGNLFDIFFEMQEMQQSVFAMVAQRTRPSGPARERSTTDTLSTDVTGIGRS